MRNENLEYRTLQQQIKDCQTGKVNSSTEKHAKDRNYNVCTLLKEDGLSLCKYVDQNDVLVIKGKNDSTGIECVYPICLKKR